MWGVDPSQPYNMTVSDIIAKVIQQVVGDGPMGAMATQFGMPLITQAMGLQGPGYRSALLDTPIMSNMTPYGLYMDNMQRQIDRVSTDALTRQYRKAQQQWQENITRTTMSMNSWRAQEAAAGRTYSDAEAKDAYNVWVESKAAGDMNGFFWSTAYKMLDPNGLGAASEYLKQAGASQVRFGRQNGILTAMTHARAVGNLFMDNGEFKFDSREYGNLGVGEAAGVAAALSKEIDFFAGVSKDGPYKMEDAVKRLKEMTKSYTKALGPLKDIFGTDLPGMISAIEDLSGRKFTSLSAEQVHNLSREITAATYVGGYDIGTWKGIAKQVEGGFMKMNVPAYLDLASMQVSQTMLNMTASGYAPAGMSLARYRSMASDWAMRTAASTGADYLNNAAAVWMSRNQDKSFDDFITQYTKARNAGGDNYSVIRDMLGTSNAYELRRMAEESGFGLRAVEYNVGGRLAQFNSLERDISRARRYARNGEAFDEAITVFMEHPELLQNEKALNSSNLLSDAAKREGNRLLRNGEFSARFVGAINEDRKRKASARQMSLQAAMEDVKSAVPSGLLDFANKLIEGKTDFGDIFTDQAKIAMKDPEMLAYLTDAAKMAKIQAEHLGLTEEEAEKYRNDYLSYAFNNGLVNEQFLGAIEDFRSGNKDAMLAATGNGHMASIADKAQIEEAYGKDKVKEGLNDLKGRWSEAYKAARDDKKTYEDAVVIANQEVEDQLLFRNVVKQLKDRGIDLNEARYGSTIKDLEDLAKKSGSVDIEEMRNLIGEKLTVSEKGKADLALNTAAGISSTDTHIDGLVAQIKILIENLNKIIAEGSIKHVHTINYGSLIPWGSGSDAKPVKDKDKK